MQRIYIIPGFRETKANKIYGKLARQFSRLGIQPVIIVPRWARHTMTEYIAEVDRLLPDHASKDYILGFSFGAYIAFVLSTRRRFRHQFLCSVSPYFREYIPSMKKSWKTILGPRRMRDFSGYRLRALVRSVQTPMSVFLGAEEGQVMHDVFDEIMRHVPMKTRAVKIKGVAHKIRDPRYSRSVMDDVHQVIR